MGALALSFNSSSCAVSQASREGMLNYGVGQQQKVSRSVGRSSLKEQREVEESRAVNPDECFLLPDGLDFKEISSKAGRGARYAYFST